MEPHEQYQRFLEKQEDNDSFMIVDIDEPVVDILTPEQIEDHIAKIKRVQAMKHSLLSRIKSATIKIIKNTLK
jgi:hypothetical protein